MTINDYDNHDCNCVKNTCIFSDAESERGPSNYRMEENAKSLIKNEELSRKNNKKDAKKICESKDTQRSEIFALDQTNRK